MKSIFAICSLVLIGALYVSAAEPGFVKVYNSGGYVARFIVEYKDKDGKAHDEDSGTLSLGVSKTIKIPEDAKSVFVKTLNYWFIGATSTVFTETFPGPVKKCYKIWGTTLNPSWATDTC